MHPICGVCVAGAAAVVLQALLLWCFVAFCLLLPPMYIVHNNTYDTTLMIEPYHTNRWCMRSGIKMQKTAEEGTR